MATAIQTISNQKITLTQNPNVRAAEKKGRLGQAVLRYLNSHEGLLHFGQVAERGPMFANAALGKMGYPRSDALATCYAKSGASWTWLMRVPRAIIMTPGVIKDVKEAFSAANDPTQTTRQKKFQYEKAVREITDAGAVYANSTANVLSLFPSLSKLFGSALLIGQTSILIHDATNLKIGVQNYRYARALDLSKATLAMKEVVEQTKTYNMWAVAKEVAAVIAGGFILNFMITGAMLLPEIALAGLLLAATVCSITRKLYEETMTYKPVFFFDNKTVTLLS